MLGLFLYSCAGYSKDSENVRFAFTVQCQADPSRSITKGAGLALLLLCTQRSTEHDAGMMGNTAYSWQPTFTAEPVNRDQAFILLGEA